MTDIHIPSPPSAARPARLSLRGFALSLQQELFNADRGLFGTWWQLWRRPGATLRRYIEWRDPALTPPIRYALILLALAALMLQGLGIGADFLAGFQQGLAADGSASGPDSAVAASIAEHLDWWLYLAVLPAMTAALESGYRGRLNTAEALAFSTYALAQAGFGVALLILLWAAATDTAGSTAFVLFPLYFGAACLGYFRPEGHGIARAAGTTVIMLFYLALFTLALAFVGMALARALG